ncbi:choice-of-anchor Q domain-containing protein [uncultured Cytophaga sp.]|uniref:choice-of-anchor Q domain-containing protein n=1 Tax=uncultured Cytophaga sp. TaxID=160238 RepID=UPI00262434C6|nr:choice-of-anchor Q domain-containing protein [uncultured Cytophaga sp.]
MRYCSLCFFIILVLHFFGCKPKDEELSNNVSNRLSFSEDTIFFDTLFASVGSITKRLIVYNPNKNKIRVSSIILAGGSNSPYSIIVNGRSGPLVSDLEILGKDSVYVLVKVLINPSNQNMPFLVSDSILFNTNTNNQKILLETYGQDAHFYKKTTLPCNTTWTNDKPYVLYDTIQIGIGCELKIEAGCKIYMHNAAAINVKGRLTVDGTKTDSVLIASDKLDASAKADLGQWGGIIFQTTSTDNRISWTTIRNATTALKLFSVVDADTIAELSLDHVSILYTSKGLIDAATVDLNGSNILLSNSPYAALKHLGGCGVWKHCTFVNYSTRFVREEPCLVLGDNASSLKMYVFNSILWGDKTDEILATNTPALFVQSSIWKSAFLGTHSTILNADPLFKNSTLFNFQLKDTSPAIDLCLPVGISDDLIGTPRDANPDAGAYEFQ